MTKTTDKYKVIIFQDPLMGNVNLVFVEKGEDKYYLVVDEMDYTTFQFSTDLKEILHLKSKERQLFEKQPEELVEHGRKLVIEWMKEYGWWKNDE